MSNKDRSNYFMGVPEDFDFLDAPQKIEIDISSLQKTENRIWIKPTDKRKGHWRKSRSKNDD